MSSVLTAKDGPVGIVTLNRPDRLNAWTRQLQSELFDALEAFDHDEGIRVVVVTGAGRGFCAGADMDGLSSVSTSSDSIAGSQSREQRSAPPPETRSFLLAQQLSKPVLAAINGPVAGVGLSWVLTCDMRFANKAAKFSCAFSKRGLVAEYGTSFLLPRMIGTGNAMMLLMSSDIFLGDEAVRLGLVQKCFDGDVLEQTVAFAKRLAANVSPVSMAVMKRQLWNHPRMEDQQALRESVVLMHTSITPQNSDFKEGVRSFIEKRPAAFRPVSKDNPVIVTANLLIPAGSKL